MFIRAILFLTSILFCVISASAKDLKITFSAVQILSVYDGDTFRIDLPCEYAVLCKNIPVRAAGIDAPEIKSKEACEKSAAKKAKKFTQNFLKQKDIALKNCKRDKYFRLLCGVWAADKNLAAELLSANLAVPYDGGRKHSINWCATPPAQALKSINNFVK
jgi:endonuclease YncB( thermonuclease family)